VEIGTSTGEGNAVVNSLVMVKSLITDYGDDEWTQSAARL